MSQFAVGEETLNETQYIKELKLAAGILESIHIVFETQLLSYIVVVHLHIGIGLMELAENSDEDEADEHYETNDLEDIKVPVVTSLESGTRTRTCSTVNIKDLLEKYRKPDQWLDNKTYTRLLLPDEFVVKESLVWKRSGWSFKHRWLVLTNKPRLFYTTPAVRRKE